MKIGLSYNIFDGQELLPYSIMGIRPHVDHISIVYQLISNRAQAADPELEDLLRALVEGKWVDELYYYQPDLSQSPKINEFNKRCIGLELAKKAGCTHFMTIDADEFYRPGEFRAAAEFIRHNRIDSSAACIVSYIQQPIFQIVRPKPAYVSFLCRIEAGSKLNYAGDFPVMVDVTRRIDPVGTFHLFDPAQLSMQHMWLVRRDLEKKSVSASSERRALICKNAAAWQYGRPFKAHEDADVLDVIRVENEFKIDLDRMPSNLEIRKRKTILITNHNLELMAGSEITTLETARLLQSMDYNVHVAAFHCGSPMQDILCQNHITVFNLLESELPRTQYDIAWCHHAQVLSRAVGQGVRFRKVLLRVMSPIEPLAAMPYYVNDLDVVAATSPGTAEHYHSEGWIDKERIDIFANSIGAEFFERPKTGFSHTLAKIAVISNRFPAEVEQAVEQLRGQSMEVDIIGIRGTPRFVTPDVLRPYDLVITIGKTVQYCFAMKVPVYCYDRFGGHGYITPDNLEKAEYYTFSGRCSNRRLEAGELVRDILDGWQGALGRLGELQAIARDRYDLKKNVLFFLTKLQGGEPNPVFYDGRFSKELKVQMVHNEYYCNVLKERSLLRRQIENNRLQNELSQAVTIPKRSAAQRAYDRLPRRMKPVIKLVAKKLRIC